MTDTDDRLEDALSRIEAGAPVEQALAELADDDLAALVRLATTVRETPHPEPTARPAARRGFFEGVMTTPRRWMPALAATLGVSAFAVCAAALWFGSALWGSPDMSYATVREVEGRVEIAAVDGAWHAASPGEHVRTGQRLRTGAAAGVSLAFFEGTTTQVGPNAELALTRIDGERGDVLQVELTQVLGTTTHNVIPLRGSDSLFVVHTPGGAAQVRGTTFSVAVDAKGAARYAVDTGHVIVDSAEQQVELLSGQATVAMAGRAPAPPAYQFVGQGTLTRVDGTTWIVGGMTLVVGPEALATLSPAPVIGSALGVTGRILADGVWYVDALSPSAAPESFFDFTGPLQDLEGDEWVAAGVAFLVADSTVRDDDLKAGDLVSVNFTVVDGLRLATRIDAVALERPTPTPTASPDPAAQPNLVFEPEALRQTGCTSAYVFAGTLHNAGGEPDDVAAHVALTYTIVKGAEFVEMVELEPKAWETIDSGESVAFLTTLTLDEDWDGVTDGSEVVVRVSVGGETNRPGRHTSTLTLTVAAACDRTPTPSTTATVTLTPTVTSTLTVTPTLTLTPVGTAVDCTGADPHPTGTKLAARYGVPYAEIMGWFCQGFGFGEIEIAYDLSGQTGLTVTEIFDLRKSGLGWGQIMQQLGVKGGGGKPTDLPGGRPTHAPGGPPKGTPDRKP